MTANTSSRNRTKAIIQRFPNAFYGCNSLTDIYYKGDVKAWIQLMSKCPTLEFNGPTIHYNFNGTVNMEVPFGQYQFRVVDKGGNALSGVQVTYGTQSGVTNKDGMVSFRQYTVGTPLVTAKLDGYFSWSNVNSNWTKSDSRCETIILYPADMGAYKLSECRYSNQANMSNSTDLLTQTKTLNIKNTGNSIGDLDFGNFYLTCRAAEADGVARYELRQSGSVIAQSPDGNFGKLSVTWFSKGSGVTVRVVTTGGRTVDTPINLQFTGNKVNSSTGIDAMDKISIRVGDDVPFLGGNTVSLGFDALPVDVKTTDTGIYIGFNKKLGEEEDPLQALKKTMDTAKRAGSLTLNKNTKTALKNMMKESKSFALPGAKFEATVIGYAEGDWGSSEAKGELYILLEGQTKTFGFNTVVVVVPVTVQVKAFAEFQAGGALVYNWSTNQVDGGVNLELTVGLDAFGGVGVGKAVGVGAYGRANVGVAGQLMGTKRGFEKVDLTGELGLKAYIGALSWGRAFAHNTWHLYTRNNVRTLAAEKDPVLLGLYDADAYQVESLDYLLDESGWLGDSMSLLSVDANTDLTPLLEHTYRNAQPVLLSAGEALYAAFLRGDAESGHVSVWVTRFDGAGWAAPVQVDGDAILDDAPTLCADGAGNVWLAYARTTAEPGDSLLTYAQNQIIVVGKIDPDTLQFRKEAEYAGQGYAHLQQLVAVDGHPVLVWVDSTVTDDNSVLFPQNSRLYTASCSDGVWSAPALAAQEDRPIWQMTAGDRNGTLAVAYIRDEDGDPGTETDHTLYQLEEGGPQKLAADVQGTVTFGILPGETEACFLWNGEDALHTANGSVAVPGITGEYAVVGDSIYFSTASGGSADLAVLQYHDGVWGEPIRLTDGSRYLEDLSMARWNGRDYVLGMHTYAEIGEAVETDKNLVWAVVQPVSDLRLESVEYDVASASAGAEIPVTLSVYNGGDHAVSGVDIWYGGTLKRVSCMLRPAERAEFTVVMTCPQVCTTYNVSVAETGRDGDDFTPEDNSRPLQMGYADVAVELKCEQVGTDRRLVAVLTNQGVETASGTLLFTDGDGNDIGYTVFEDLNSGVSLLSILPLQESFSGVVTVLAEAAQEELYTYNNTARQTVLPLPEPTSIRTVRADGTQVSAQVFLAENGESTVLCAVYDGAGRLLETLTSAVSQGEQTVDFTASAPFASAEVFVMDGDCVPLCASMRSK